MADKVKTALLLGVCVNWPCWAVFDIDKTVKNERAVAQKQLCGILLLYHIIEELNLLILLNAVLD